MHNFTIVDARTTCIAPGDCRGCAAPDCAESEIRLGDIVETEFFQVGKVLAVDTENGELVVDGCGIYLPEFLHKIDPSELTTSEVA